PFAVAGAAGGAGERGDGLGHGAVVAAWRAGCKPRGSCRRAGGFAPPSSYTTIPRDIFMMKKSARAHAVVGLHRAAAAAIPWRDFGKVGPWQTRVRFRVTSS